MKQHVVVRLDLSRLVHFQHGASLGSQAPASLFDVMARIVPETVPNKDWTLKIKWIDITDTCLQPADLGQWEQAAVKITTNARL